tara:strand:- start:335 stop:1501 length:1167 start_codon:yes stop_codon:yes gene_type:complete
VQPKTGIRRYARSRLFALQAIGEGFFLSERSILTQVRAALVPTLLMSLTFAAVASAVSLFLRHQAPVPDMNVLSPKLAAYQAHADVYDTVFIGTSRTFYHVVPDDVEDAVESAGCPRPNVFNFGVFGLTGAEQDWLVDQVLDAGKGTLRTVVIEDPLPEARALDNATNERARFFHGPAEYDATVKSISSFPESVPKKIFRFGIFGAGAAYDLSGVGRAAALFFPAPEKPVPFKLDMEFDGFEILGSHPTADIDARRKDFLEHPDKFDAAMARYGAASDENVAARAIYLEERLRRIRALGLNAALFISPDPAELDRTPRVGVELARIAPDLPVLNFNRPDAYPDLFERGLWFDHSHYGEAGARALSRVVGAELCSELTRSDAGAQHAIR